MSNQMFQKRPPKQKPLAGPNKLTEVKIPDVDGKIKELEEELKQKPDFNWGDDNDPCGC